MEFVMNMFQRMWPKIRNRVKIKKALFFDILDFILIQSTYFIHEGQIHQQIDGCAMGQNISPTIANFVTDELLECTMKKLPFDIKLCEKYVDGILMLVPQDKIQTVLDTLNSFHAKVQFTMENENDKKQIAYLDMLVTRENNGELSVDWYNKPTASNKLLNWLSFHPKKHKTNVAFNLFYRVLGLSDTRFHEQNVNKAIEILRILVYCI